MNIYDPADYQGITKEQLPYQHMPWHTDKGQLTWLFFAIVEFGLGLILLFSYSKIAVLCISTVAVVMVVLNAMAFAGANMMKADSDYVNDNGNITITIKESYYSLLKRPLTSKLRVFISTLSVVFLIAVLISFGHYIIALLFALSLISQYYILNWLRILNTAANLAYLRNPDEQVFKEFIRLAKEDNIGK